CLARPRGGGPGRRPALRAGAPGAGGWSSHGRFLTDTAREKGRRQVLQLPGFNFTPLPTSGVPGPEHPGVALHAVRRGPGPGDWSCSPTVSGRFVSWACVDRLIVSRKVNFTYYVL